MTDPTTEDPGALTPAEHAAMDVTAALVAALRRVVTHGPTRRTDLSELISGHIHPIQNAILAQAAARSYPDRYRLMGESLHVAPIIDEATTTGDAHHV